MKPPHPSPDKLKSTALAYLSRRDYSEREITQKLKTKGYPSDAIAQILAELVHEGLINELRFTENYIHWCRAKGWGPSRIAHELQTRGISAEMIAEQLKITDNAWFTEVRNLWQKRFKGKHPTDFKSRAKQMRFLQYRGFSREQILSLFKDIDINEE